MDLDSALDLARAGNQSVLVTIRANGRPQISNVLHHLGDDGVIRISITADRAKYKNLLRTPWAALHVNGRDFWAFAVIEGDVALSEVAATPHDAVTDELVDLYPKLVRAPITDETEYRQRQVTERRVLLSLTPNRAYGTRLNVSAD